MDSCTELLIQAVTRNDTATIKHCLRRGANVNKIGADGITPLGAAARTGNLSTFKLLVGSTRKLLQQQQQVDVDANDNQSTTTTTRPIFLQLENTDVRKKNIGYFVVCKDLDENELGDGPTPDGMDALEWDMEIGVNDHEEDIASSEINIYKWYAKILNQSSIVLRSPEYDLGRLDAHGQTVLHYAVCGGNTEMVDYLLATFAEEIQVNQSDSTWSTPLHIACERGDVEIVRHLLCKGANVKAANAGRVTPLHCAARHGHLQLAQVLVEHGADLNAYDMEDRSALSVAIDNQHEDVAEFLIRSGTRLNHEECLGYTPLYKAVWNNLLRTSANLLAAGAKIVHSHHLLHVATRHSNYDLVRLLSSHGAVLNIRDEHGNTPLMAACINRHLEIARYFLQHGAPANTVNLINGMTALHLCVQGMHDPQQFAAFLELLLVFDVDLNAHSYQGNVLFYSIILGNLEAARLLVQHGVDVNLRDEHAYFDNLSLAKKQGDLQLAKMIVYAGFDFRNLLFSLATLKSTSKSAEEGSAGDDPVYDFLVDASRTPLNLRQLCRIRIRRQLTGKHLIARIHQLPLPSIILHYLALDIL